MINLEKGENTAINSTNYTGSKLLVGLDWKTKDKNDFDIDGSAFLLNSDEIVRSSEDFIFYNQLIDNDNCIELNTDSDNKDYTNSFFINLSKIPYDIDKIMFVLTIDKAEEREQNFRMVDDVKFLIMDEHNNSLIKCIIETDYEEVSLMVCSLYRYKNEWKIRSIGQGFSKGLEAIAHNYKVKLEDLKEPNNKATLDVQSSNENSLKRKRKTPNQVLTDHTTKLLAGIEEILPTIQDAKKKKINESNTRMILDRIFIDLFGYKINEVKAEQEIQGRRADYVLSTGGVDSLVVEVKKAGMILRDKQTFQATSYGAYSGIRWVLLTNLVQWNMYHVSTQDKVDASLMFSVDLSNGVTQQDANLLVLMSSYGLNRKGLMEKEWAEANALSENSITSSILTKDVISKIRQVVKRDKGVTVSNEKIQAVLENILNLS